MKVHISPLNKDSESVYWSDGYTTSSEIKPKKPQNCPYNEIATFCYGFSIVLLGFISAVYNCGGWGWISFGEYFVLMLFSGFSFTTVFSMIEVRERRIRYLDYVAKP